MAGAVAHHFNNQLFAVMGNIELALNYSAADDINRKYLVEAMLAARRSSEISKLMLTYVGQIFGKRQTLDLSMACRRNLPMLQASLPEGIVLETDLMPIGPLVLADENQMQLILTHLISNGFESMGSNPGRMVLATRTFAAAAIPNFYRTPADWQPPTEIIACLEVSDSGGGVKEEDLDRLFDPFFTTKFTGRGLGLPVTLGIVKAWDGAIDVESGKGQGSTFRVLLPIQSGGGDI